MKLGRLVLTICNHGKQMKWGKGFWFSSPLTFQWLSDIGNNTWEPWGFTDSQVESWLSLFCHSRGSGGHCAWRTGSVLSTRLAWVCFSFHPQVVEHQYSGTEPLCPPDCAAHCYLCQDCGNSPGEGIRPGTSCWWIWVCHIYHSLSYVSLPHQVLRDAF